MKGLLSLGLLLFASTAFAQQAPKYGVTSPPPNPPQYGVKPAPFAATPYVFDTAEQHGIKVTVLAKGFKRPFGMAFLPDGDPLISERGGDLRIVHNPTSASPVLDPNPVPGMPKTGRGGLHDIALHPDFAHNHWLYFTYLDDAPDGPLVDGTTHRSFLTLKRGKLEDGRLTGVETLVKAGASWPTASRVQFGKDGKVWVTSGGPFDNQSQELESFYGKVLGSMTTGRFRPTIPSSARRAPIRPSTATDTATSMVSPSIP